MASEKLITLERLTKFKQLQDQYNSIAFLGVHGTADKATELATTRTIDGVNFNGTQNITLPTKVVRIYSNDGTFYTDSAKTVAFNASSYTNPEEKLFIDVTTGKSAYWNGTALQYIEAADNVPKIPVTEKGAANGVATLGNDVKVPNAQLPDFVDDVVEVAAAAVVNNKIVLYSDEYKTQPVTGETGKIYVDVNATIDGNYRWGGSEAGFIKVGSNVSSANVAIKATNDADGNQIDTTYVKKETGKGLMTDTQASQLSTLVQNQADRVLVTEQEVADLFKMKLNTVPIVSGNPTYDGTAVSPTLSGYDANTMTLSGNTSATNAGNYTAYVTPKSGYVWDSSTGYSESASVSVQWSVQKATPTVTLSTDNLDIPLGNYDTFTYTYNGDGNLSVSSSDTNVATCTTSGNTVTVTSVATGSCNINIMASAGDNYNSVSGVSVGIQITSIKVLTDSYYKMSDVYPSTYQTMTTVPDILDISNVNNMYNMFFNCTSLTTIPQLDTSNVTNMQRMFNNCTNLTTIPQLNTSNVTDMYYMFRYCSSLPSTFPWIIDCSSISNANDMTGMFKNSSVTNVTLANVSDSIKSSITSQLLKGDNTLTINFV